MNKAKLINYRLTGSIHTLAVKTKGLVEAVEESVSKCIISSSQVKDDGRTTTSIVNPNKLGVGEIVKFSEFEAAFDTILAGAGISDYSIVRVDMRFDSYDPEHYQAYAKLNRYLISALAVCYDVRNCYRSTDLFSQKQLSIAIKNKYFELENYDKAAESDGTDIAQSRLEERSKAWTDTDLRREFCEHWFNRWDKALRCLDEVQKRYNDELVRIYTDGKNAYPRQFRSVTDFLLEYQGCIFTKAQMIDLLSRIPEVGSDKAKTKAENFKKRYGIEYFSQNDAKTAVDEIKRATVAFFAE